MVFSTLLFITFIIKHALNFFKRLFQTVPLPPPPPPPLPTFPENIVLIEQCGFVRCCDECRVYQMFFNNDLIEALDKVYSGTYHCCDKNPHVFQSTLRIVNYIRAQVYSDQGHLDAITYRRGTEPVKQSVEAFLNNDRVFNYFFEILSKPNPHCWVYSFLPQRLAKMKFMAHCVNFGLEGLMCKPGMQNKFGRDLSGTVTNYLAGDLFVDANKYGCSISRYTVTQNCDNCSHDNYYRTTRTPKFLKMTEAINYGCDSTRLTRMYHYDELIFNHLSYRLRKRFPENDTLYFDNLFIEAFGIRNEAQLRLRFYHNFTKEYLTFDGCNFDCKTKTFDVFINSNKYVVELVFRQTSSLPPSRQDYFQNNLLAIVAAPVSEINRYSNTFNETYYSRIPYSCDSIFELPIKCHDKLEIPILVRIDLFKMFFATQFYDLKCLKAENERLRLLSGSQSSLLNPDEEVDQLLVTNLDQDYNSISGDCSTIQDRWESSEW